MTAPARFTQADLTRAFKAASKAGVGEYRISLVPDGHIEIIVSETSIASVKPVELD